MTSKATLAAVELDPINYKRIPIRFHSLDFFSILIESHSKSKEVEKATHDLIAYADGKIVSNLGRHLRDTKVTPSKVRKLLTLLALG